MPLWIKQERTTPPRPRSLAEVSYYREVHDRLPGQKKEQPTAPTRRTGTATKKRS